MNTEYASKADTKKTWETPVLVIHGDVTEVTAEMVGSGLSASG